MRRLLLTLLVLAIAFTLTTSIFADDRGNRRGTYGYGCGWGPGYNWSSGHMMASGGDWRGGHMTGYGRYGWGMCRWNAGPGPSPQGWESMTSEQRALWEKNRAEYQMNTLELRKQLAAKHIELDTLWSQPDVDSKKVDKLSNEVAELEAELAKKRDKYLVQCRSQFGNRGWTCPGGWW